MTLSKKKRIVDRFAQAAPKYIRRYLPVNCCIEGTRLAIETLRRFRVHARPQVVELIVKIPALTVAFCAGLTAEHTALAAKHAGSFVEAEHTANSWDGHLVAIVEDRWILDASFEQGFRRLVEAGAIEVEEWPNELWVLPISHPEYEGMAYNVVAGGEEMEVQYLWREENSYRECPAWAEDESIVEWLAEMIDMEMR